MPIIASAAGTGTDFQPCPAGPAQAVCVDIIDNGIVTVQYGTKPPKKQHKVTIRWESDEKMDDGRPFLVQRRFTLSLHEKSALRPFLESWRGRAFTEDEAVGFDLEKLIGVNAFLNISHRKVEGKTWADVATVMPLPKAMVKIEPTGKYVRMCDRAPEPNAAASEQPEAPYDPPDRADDDIPF